MLGLREMRMSVGLTQAEVAQKIFIPQSYYSRIERGQIGESLPVPTAKKIAAVLGFNWTRFYEDEVTL